MLTERNPIQCQLKMLKNFILFFLFIFITFSIPVVVEILKQYSCLQVNKIFRYLCNLKYLFCDIVNHSLRRILCNIYGQSLYCSVIVSFLTQESSGEFSSYKLLSHMKTFQKCCYAIHLVLVYFADLGFQV